MNEGLLVERHVTEDDKLPTLFSLLHPLDDIMPLITRIGEALHPLRQRTRSVRQLTWSVRQRTRSVRQLTRGDTVRQLTAGLAETGENWFVP